MVAIFPFGQLFYCFLTKRQRDSFFSLFLNNVQFGISVFIYLDIFPCKRYDIRMP